MPCYAGLRRDVNRMAAMHNELKHEKKVHFGRTMHSLPQRLKSTFQVECSQRGPGAPELR